MTEKPAEYRVLARKYRPATFDDLIGQDVLVQTLSNAIARGRIAHAFLLTGIRGIGKTTTARIIAKALNCVGPDGQGGPTIHPCGVCANCVAIAEDRHLDVMEMDAASRTGVDNIRDLIDTVHYAPTNARYKIYIIDEVHMLSKGAFNALLKTLEEPPPHVKFIFATTELRKIPVTILSRCQRFELKRVEGPELVAHLARICAEEQVEAEPDALAMIAQAADGSVRDALSLTDRAIAHADEAGGVVQLVAGQIAQLLGVADKGESLTLLSHVFRGELPEALERARQHYAAGGEAAGAIGEWLEIVHHLTLLKTGAAPDDAGIFAPADAARARQMVESLSMAVLAQAWQMLLKGLQEAQAAPQPQLALEMLLVRLVYLSSQPAPGELLRQVAQPRGTAAPVSPAPAPARTPGPVLQAMPQPEISQPGLHRLEDVVEMLAEHKEMLLHQALYREARLVSFAPGRLELNLLQGASLEFPGQLSRWLSEQTGQRWMVMLSRETGAPTLHEQAQDRHNALRQRIENNPLVARVLEMFPGASIESISQGDAT